jgi:hypothetical protein
LDQAVRRRAFTRALRVEVMVPNGLSDALLREHLARISQHDHQQDHQHD